MPSLGTILVLDDDVPTCTLISNILTDEGYAAYAVDNALTGIVALGKGLPNLILCDYHLPVSDGLAFVQSVRSLGIDVPIVLMTADMHPPTNLEDVAFCLLKPFDITDLLDCVKTHIRLR